MTERARRTSVGEDYIDHIGEEYRPKKGDGAKKEEDGEEACDAEGMGEDQKSL